MGMTGAWHGHGIACMHRMFKCRHVGKAGKLNGGEWCVLYVREWII